MKSLINKGNRVRKSTSTESNVRIDEQTFRNLKSYSGGSYRDISMRLEELDEEWDIERLLEVNMSALAVTGILLSYKNKKWLALPAVVLGFFAQQALQGWCPPVKIFRYFKVRTREEIDQEKHALKAMRGDFKDIKSAEEAFMSVKD